MYVLVHIGCWECNEITKIVGVFSDLETAEESKQQLMATIRWCVSQTCSNTYEILTFPKTDQINENIKNGVINS